LAAGLGAFTAYDWWWVGSACCVGRRGGSWDRVRMDVSVADDPVGGDVRQPSVVGTTCAGLPSHRCGSDLIIIDAAGRWLAKHYPQSELAPTPSETEA
ncbi:MAG: hypothetical protein WAN44_12155, partial [Propionibacteriaceae bacterium]